MCGRFGWRKQAVRQTRGRWSRQAKESPMCAPVSRGEAEGRSHAALTEVQRASWRDVPSRRRAFLQISSGLAPEVPGLKTHAYKSRSFAASRIPQHPKASLEVNIQIQYRPKRYTWQHVSTRETPRADRTLLRIDRGPPVSPILRLHCCR